MRILCNSFLNILLKNYIPTMYIYSPLLYAHLSYFILIVFMQVKAELCLLDTISANENGAVTIRSCELDEFDLVIPNTKELYMGGVQLKEIPKVLEKYSQLLLLDLSNNAITSCPDSLVLLELTELLLSNNPIQVFNMSGASLPKTEQLYLDNTTLKTFPKSIGTLKALKNLDISNNNFERENIMNTKFPPNLTSLHLVKMGLREIPLDIYNLENLTYLDLLENKLDPIVLSQIQLQFLNKLDRLYMTAPSSVDSCDTSQSLQKLSYREWSRSDSKLLNVCVTEYSIKNSTEAPSINLTEPPIVTTTQPPIINSTNTPWLYIILIPISLLVGVSTITFYIVSRNHTHEKETTIEMGNIQIGQTVQRDLNEPSIPYGMLDDKNVEIYPDIYIEPTQPPISILEDPNPQIYTSINSSHELNLSKFPMLYNSLLVYRLNVKDIDDIKIIGAGGFATVWLVQYQNERYLASKRLRTGDLSIYPSNQINEFTKEIRMVSMLKHANIVEFVGVAWNGNNKHLNLQMLFEYMEGGDLRDCLQCTRKHANEHPILPYEWTRTKLQIVRDIASALIYVHSFKPPIIHRDLKARNILLSANGQTAKIGDFGVARIRAQNVTSMTTNVGTARWLAPEVARGSKNYNESADIYAFGMILCELDSHDVPFARVTNEENEPLHEQAVQLRLAMGLLNPMEAIDTIENSTMPEGIYTLAKRCLARTPRDRPNATDIYQEVTAIFDEFK